MARSAVLINRNWLSSSEIAGGTDAQEVILLRLLLICDDYGRFLNDPVKLKYSIVDFRHSPDLIKSALDYFESQNVISRYTAGDPPISVCAFNSWEKYQSIRWKNDAEYPDPSGNYEPGNNPNLIRKRKQLAKARLSASKTPMRDLFLDDVPDVTPVRDTKDDGRPDGSFDVSLVDSPDVSPAVPGPLGGLPHVLETKLNQIKLNQINGEEEAFLGVTKSKNCIVQNDTIATPSKFACELVVGLFPKKTAKEGVIYEEANAIDIICKYVQTYYPGVGDPQNYVSRVLTWARNDDRTPCKNESDFPGYRWRFLRCTQLMDESGDEYYFDKVARAYEELASKVGDKPRALGPIYGCPECGRVLQAFVDGDPPDEWPGAGEVYGCMYCDDKPRVIVDDASDGDNWKWDEMKLVGLTQIKKPEDK